MSLPRPLRLTRRADFHAVRSDGTGKGGRLLALSTLADESLTSVKAGVIVPKALGNAVVRNRIKRRLREIARRHAAELPPRRFVVTVARRGAVTAEFAQLESEWCWLARKLGLLPHKPSTSTPPPPA